jgi:5-formyltetrahydrofolate cyclo-ligase
VAAGDGAGEGRAMNAVIREQKAELRRNVRSEIRRLSAADRAAASALVCSRLQSERIWREAETILLYMLLGDEVDVGALARDALSLGKTVAFPCYDRQQGAFVACRVTDLRSDLLTGEFGVAEPRAGCPVVPPNRLDFAVIPGVAFTLKGRRLGRGKGFYDRLLASVGGVKCGVAFDEQIVDEIPLESHDIRLDWIVTPTRSVRASEQDARF